MRPLLLLSFLFFSSSIYAQSNPEVYLGDFSYSDEGISIENLTNISENPGYDNQPAFLPDGSALLYSGAHGESVDVVKYDINTGEKAWHTETEGGKYSPTPIPGQNYFSSIWLKPDGEQLLWKFPVNEGSPEVLVPDEIIGYHAWYDSTTMYTFVLGEHFTFVEFDLSDRIQRKVISTNPGRSIHKVPGKNEISFIDKNDSSSWVVKTYSPDSKQVNRLTPTPSGSEDMYWVNENTFIIGKGNSIHVWNESEGYSEPHIVFEKEGSISRIALSPDRTKIAVVFTASE